MKRPAARDPARHPPGPRWARRSAAAGVLVAMLGTALAGEIPPADRRSSYDTMGAETRAMQDDDGANPGMLWVLDGEALWNRRAGDADRSCADCHGDAGASMRGVAARHPAFDPRRNGPVDLATRIDLCRTERQQAPALPAEHKDRLALTAFVARQSRGLPIESADPRLSPAIAAGREIFSRRRGQLDLSCAQCHDDNRGRKLAGITVPQAHPTGYPVYRLEWQTLGSLQRRLRNCMIGMRSEPYAYGAAEMVALEAYLMWRARGMPMESPAVRP